MNTMLKQTLSTLILCVCFGAFSCTDRSSGGYFDEANTPPNSPQTDGSAGNGVVPGGSNTTSSSTSQVNPGKMPLEPSPPPEPVPEPMTMLLFGSGLAAVAYRYRRRRQEDDADTATP